MAKKRIIIIGIDGFCWTVANKMTDAGCMPQLSIMVERGCSGKLESTFPYETAPAWTAFQTGCHPDKTGIFAFHRFEKESRIIRLNNFNDIEAVSIWEILSGAGKKVITINMPLTYPAPEIDGVVIPGLLCPEISDKTVYPSSVYGKYISKYPDYDIVNPDKTGNPEEVSNRFSQTEYSRVCLASEIMAGSDWDVCCVQMQGTDAYQHVMWQRIVENNDDEFVQNFYRKIDSCIGVLRENLDSEDMCLIASDHGFCELKYSVCINAWLRKLGLLTLKDNTDNYSSILSDLKKYIKPIKWVAKFYGNIRSRRLKNSQKLFLAKDLSALRNKIDFDKTQALSLGGMGAGIYILDKPNYKKISDYIVKQLHLDFIENQDIPLVESIKTKEQMGYKNDNMPDIVIKYKPGVESRLNPEYEEVCIACSGGTHSPEGMYVIAGYDVANKQKQDRSIVDIMPTCLAYLGIPIPSGIDGEVIPAFNQALNYSSYQYDISKSSDSSNLTEQEQKQVEEKLSEIGYL